MQLNGEFQFVVEQWAALAAGLSTQEQWREWFSAPVAPVAPDPVPAAAWLPAALRRRVSPLGRAALEVLAQCQPAEPCPVIFASRHGDLQATAALLGQLREEDRLSPMGFSLAVHNSAVGIYSIARSDRTATTSLSAHHDLAEAAVIEAVGLLASGVPQVVVTCCEDAVPAPYTVDHSWPDFRYAWACRLRAAGRGGMSLAATGDGGDDDAQAVRGSCRPELGALSFLAGCAGREFRSATGRYLWRRHD